MGYISIKNKDEFKWTYNNIPEISQIKIYDEMDWLVIGRTQFSSDNKSSSYYELKEGDIIKIGKVMFKVREVKPNQNDVIDPKKDINNNETDINDRLKSIYIKSQLSNKKNKKVQTKPYTCRICLNESIAEDNTNPLINPCNCIGSVRYIHLDCLRQWLSSKIAVKTSYDSLITAYSFKEFQCEICKSTLPHRIKVNGEIISLINIEDVTTPYLVLESIPHQFHINTNSRDNAINIYVVRFTEAKSEIKIGRSNDAELRLSDISVSRNHSCLIYRKGHFFIQDLRSKFGTLLLLQNEITFLPYKSLSIQIGKFHINFKLCRTLMSWFKCYRNKVLSKMNYDTMLKTMKMIIYDDEVANIKSVDYSDDEDESNDKVKLPLLNQPDDDSIETENVNNVMNSSKVRLVEHQESDVEKKIAIIFKKLHEDDSTKKKNKKISNTNIILINSHKLLLNKTEAEPGGATAREQHN